jgi:hypothetical protein
MRTVLPAIIILVMGLCGKVFANESWQDALSKMPFEAGATNLARTNAIPPILNSFQSNGVVKALIFMPGAADEFVFLRRAHVTLTKANPSLADAIVALTNQTYIQAAFRPPFLLLYTTQDLLEPINVVKSQSAAAKLQARTVPGRMVFCDSNWDDTRRAVARKLSVRVLPLPDQQDAPHFWPNNFAACDLTQWELLEAVALSGKTTFTLHWLTADFQLDMRPGPVPNPSSLPVP